MQETRFHVLRKQQLALATKEFKARGASVDRCERCLLAKRVCICGYTPTIKANADLILLFHREELFKPTNTGRLLMDALPENTFGFCWSRTEPDEQLLSLLGDPNRRCLIVFPFDESLPQYAGRKCHQELFSDGRRLTFILLDGTWKQAGRMFHLSKWMEHLDSIALSLDMQRGYQVRKSHEENYVSTYEAGLACFEMAGYGEQLLELKDYFEVFNCHYLALRGCHAVAITDSHRRLLAQD